MHDVAEGPMFESIVGHGIDVVAVGRVRRALDTADAAWALRVYSQRERAEADPPPLNARYYAGRFAAKEAVAKALGTGFSSDLTWAAIEILRNGVGAPEVHVHGAAREAAERLGVTRWLISISHCGDSATASVIAMGHSLVGG